MGKLAEESRKSTDTIKTAIDKIKTFSTGIGPALIELASVMEKNQEVFGRSVENFQAEEQSIGQIYKALEEISLVGENLVGDINKLVESA